MQEKKRPKNGNKKINTKEVKTEWMILTGKGSNVIGLILA